MSVTYKDIDDLSQKSSVAGTEKLPVSDTEYITPSQISSLGGNAKIFYGTCSSSAGTYVKTVTCSEFTSSSLVKGALVFVTFDNTNSADSEDLVMNVNSTGNKPIKMQYGEGGSVNYLRYDSLLRTNCTYLFAYDGTNWLLLTTDSDRDNNTTYSVIGSSEAETGTETTARTVSAASLKRDIEYRMTQNQADWNESSSSSPSYIQNKPTIPDGLPSVTSSDNGKVLTVVSGEWAAATASGGGGGGSTVTWGTESNNTVPLTVDNTSKTLLLSSIKVTSVSSSSTDNEIPTAKCLYDIVGDIETLLAAL